MSKEYQLDIQMHQMRRKLVQSGFTLLPSVVVSRLTNPSTLHVLLQGRIPGVAVTFHSVFTLFFDIDSASLKDLVLLYYAVIGCGRINKQLKTSVSLSFHGKYQIFVFHFITNSRPQFLWKLNISFAFINKDQIMHVLSMAPRFKRM